MPAITHTIHTMGQMLTGSIAGIAIIVIVSFFLRTISQIRTEKRSNIKW